MRLALPQRGFTLIELLVGITIAGVLAAIGVPALSGWLQNAKIDNTAKEALAGLQMARTEAIRRNVPVEFVLTGTATDQADLANTLTPAANGVNWAVRAASDVAGAPFELVNARAGAEGANSGTATRAGTITALNPPGFGGTVTFQGLGGTVPPVRYEFLVTNPAAGDCVAAGGPIRCKRIDVSPGGRITACDPDPALVAGDSRACPP